MRFIQGFIFICLLSWIAVSADSVQDLPDFGDSSGSVISPELERRLGKGIMRQVHHHAAVIRDPEVEAYIQSIGYKLVANSDDNSIPFIFFIINSPAINAFAAPGGVIGVNSGVILNSRTESELAGVMAHEIAHVTQRHMARAYEKQSQLSTPMAAAMIGSILLAIANPQAGVAAMAATQGLAVQNQINFTRANEEEADRVGMQFLVRSGFDPYGMPGFFERMQKATKFYGRPPEYLSTHPLTNSRIADSIARAEKYPKKEYEDSASFELIRSKLVVYAHQNPKASIKYFEERLASDQIKDKAPIRYGYALALTVDERYAEANLQLKTLLKEDRNNITYLLAAASLEAAQGNFDAALKIYEESYKFFPDYRPLVLGYVKTLLASRNPAQAREVLRKYSRHHEPDIAYYELLAQAEAETGAAIDAEIAKAEYYYLSGDTKLAIDRLRYAQQQLKLDFYQQERISARQAQFEYEFELEQQLKL